jgi:hypothetical protein
MFAQMLASAAVGATGVGSIVIVYVDGVPGQPATVGVTVMVLVTADAPAFVPVNEGTFPVPFAARPIEGSEFVQLKVPPTGLLVNAEAEIVAPLQTVMFDGTVTVGIGSTVIV